MEKPRDIDQERGCRRELELSLAGRGGVSSGAASGRFGVPRTIGRWAERKSLRHLTLGCGALVRIVEHLDWVAGLV